jgi:hypothetical protein
MSNDQQPTKSVSKSSEETSVDLGMDLLEKTAPLKIPKRSDLALDSESVEELLENAKILHGEGLSDDAKRILRKILIRAPEHPGAKHALADIHAREESQIFEESPERRSLGQTQRIRKILQEESTEQIVRGLSDELDLEDRTSRFSSETELQEFANELDRSLALTSAQDRLDLGIAFLEMGIPELAVRQFQVSARSTEHYLGSTALLAQALIAADRPFEARLSLEPILGDTELSKAQKIEFIYWLARSEEKRLELESALGFFQEVIGIDSTYRDTLDRVRWLTVRLNLR